MVNRNIEDLVEPFRTKVKLWLAENPHVFVTETTRSRERQLELYKQGYTKTMSSNHLYGQAVDIAFYGDELYPTNYQVRRNLANSALRYGIDWGYDMRYRDKPHFQDNGQPLPDKYKSMAFDYIQILNEQFPDRVPLFDYEKDGQIKALIEIGILRALANQENKDIKEIIKKIGEELQK